MNKTRLEATPCAIVIAALLLLASSLAAFEPEPATPSKPTQIQAEKHPPTKAEKLILQIKKFYHDELSTNNGES